MANIAKLGFQAETAPLDDARKKLDAIAPAAKRAENAAAGIKRGIGGAAQGIQSFAGAVSQAATGTSAMSKAALATSTAMGTVQRAAIGASGAIKVAGMAAQQYGPPTAMWEVYRQTLNKIPAAAQGARDSIQRLGKAANDNINAMQSTPGNIAAQFQDIGVTAAGGMSPLIIGLQQGTQLSAAFAGGLGNLGAALRQVFSATALLTIGLVTGLAALIQYVDWIKVAQGALTGLATGMEMAAPYAAALGATLLVAFSPYIISSIMAVTRAIGVALYGAIGKVIVALITMNALNPAAWFAALVIGAGAAVAAMVHFGVVTIAQVKGVANFIIGGFVGAFNAIKKTWSMLPAAVGDAAVQTANRVITIIENMVNRGSLAINNMLAQLPEWAGGGKRISAVRLGRLDNPNAGAAQRVNDVASGEIAAAQSKDWVGKIGSAIEGGIKWAAGKVRGWATQLGVDSDKKKDKTKKAAEGGKTDAEKQAEAFDKLRLSTEAYVRSKQAETAAVSLGAREAAMLKHQTDLTNSAIQQGITIDNARAASIQQWAKAMTDADMALANAQGWKKLQDEMKNISTDFTDQGATLGMTAEQTARYKWEVVWLRDALAGLTEPTKEQVDALREFARGAADSEVALQRTREQAERLREAFNFVRDGVKGFVSDLRSGLEQGKGFFSAFGSAVLNVLNKVLDKLVDVALNAALGGGGGGVSGFLSGLGSLFGGGGSALGASARAGANGALDALNSGPVLKFAKGGVVSGATVFNHASGRGMMGEAGPEAIMPLQRTSNGALGVAVAGGGQQRPSATIYINNIYPISGAMDVSQVEARIRQSAEQTKDDVKRSIPAVLNEYQITGTVN